MIRIKRFIPASQADRLAISRRLGFACALSILVSSAASAQTVAAAIRQVPCESFEGAVRAQPWQDGGAPFGKPYSTWTAADFNAIDQYTLECSNALQTRGVPGASVTAMQIFSFLASHRDAITRANVQRSHNELTGQWEKERRQHAQQKKSERRAIEERAETAAGAHVDNFKLLGVGPDLLDSTIYMDYVGGPRKILTFYHFLSLAFTNPTLDRLDTRRWNIGEGNGNAIEVVYKLKGRPTQGLLFSIDGTDLFANFKVENDQPLQFLQTYEGAALRSQMMREITGITDEEWTSFFVD